jgi:hypothetical protein
MWWHTGYRLRDLDEDGVPEFVSYDNRFAYTFSCFACSWFPPQIWIYRSGRFIDVTRHFPGIVSQDARQAWRAARGGRDRSEENAGALAAWTADQCLLDQCTRAWRRLEVWRQRGWIHPALGWDRTPQAYLAHLRRFLHRTGYWR